MSRYTLQAVLICSAVLVAVAAPLARQATTPPLHEHQTPDKAKPQSDMMAKCMAMKAQQEKMMADVQAADQRLDTLVVKMNAASGPARIDANAAVVTEMVAQRKTMRESMMTMQHGMMEHMGDHMQAGPGSMAMCPMMKEMGGAKR